MHPDSEHRLGSQRAAERLRLQAHRARCRRVAGSLFMAAAIPVVFLSLSGLRPPALAIPVSLAATSLLFGAASAGLFARLAHLQLLDGSQGEDGDDGGRGGGPGRTPDLPGGDGPAVDWERFEREFRSYCERAGSIQA